MHERETDPSAVADRGELGGNLAIATMIVSEALKHKNAKNRWRMTLMFLALAVVAGGIALNVIYCPITTSLEKIIAVRASIIVTCVSVFGALIRMYVLEKEECRYAQENYNRKCDDLFQLDIAYRTFNSPKFRQEMMATINEKKAVAKQRKLPVMHVDGNATQN